MQMDYFRRPMLAGKNLKRANYATIRGSVRRSDADIDSNVPYFPGITPIDTLNVSSQSGDVTVTLTGNALATIIADLNTAMTTAGMGATAYEGDGVIYLQSNTIGSDGFIQVSGGTAAAALGFSSFPKSVGGELAGAPEGRIGNPFGAVFPGKWENFAMDTLRASLGRISGNMDVLFSDLTRCDAVMRKVTDFTNNGSYLTVGSATRVFTGGLSFSSPPNDLTPFFLLIDAATKKPLVNKVKGVTRTQTTLPVSVNASSWTGTGNVLGQSLSKGTFVISSIDRARVVAVTGDISTFGVLPGDFAEVSGATNVAPFSNNGLRWVVDSVDSNSVVQLRPASQVELTELGQTLGDVQPLLELNDHLGSGEVWGSVTFHSGPFCNGVNLLVDPPLPFSLAFELWAASPRALRTGSLIGPTRAMSPQTTSIAADDPTQPDGVYTAPTTTLDGTMLDLSSFLVRAAGRYLTVPATSHDLSGHVDGTYYAIWSAATGTVGVGVGVDNIVYGASEPLFRIVKTGAALEVFRSIRLLAEGTRVLTVGTGGQFDKLEEAIEHINGFMTGEAVFPLFEILLVSDCSLTRSVGVDSPHLTVRGANPDVTLTVTAGVTSALFDLRGGGTYRFADFKVVRQGATPTPFATCGGGIGASNTRVLINGVRHSSATGPHFYSLVNMASGSFGSLEVNDSTFKVTSNVCTTTVDALLRRSSFTHSGVAGANQIFKSYDGVGGVDAPWSGLKIRVLDCTFSNWAVDAAINILVLDEGNGVDILVDKTIFTGFSSTNTGASVASVDSAIFRDCVIDGSMPHGITGNSNTVIEGCRINTRAPLGSNANACGVAIKNTFSNADVAAGGPGVGATILEVYERAVENYFDGVATTAISAATYSALIEGNRIALALASVDQKTNVINAIRSLTTTRLKVIGNEITISGGTPTGRSSAIRAETPSAIIVGNTITTTPEFSDGIAVVSVLAGTVAVIESNIVACTFLGDSDHIRLTNATGTLSGSIVGNSMSAGVDGAYGIFVDQSQALLPITLAVSGNRIQAFSSFEAPVDTLFTGSSFDANHIVSSFGTSGAPIAGVAFSGNTVTGYSYFGEGSIVSGNVLDRAYLQPADYGSVTFIGNKAVRLYSQKKSGAVGIDITARVEGNHISGQASFSGCPNNQVVGNYFGGSVGSGSGVFQANSVVGVFSGATLFESILGNDFQNDFSSTGSIVNSIISNNKFLGAVDTTCAIFSNNYVFNSSITLSGAIVADCSFANGGAYTITNCRVSNCVFNGADIAVRTSTISNCAIYGDVTLLDSATLLGNYIAGSIVHDTWPVGHQIEIQILGNFLTNHIDLSGFAVVARLMVSNNIVNGADLLGSALEDMEVVVCSNNVFVKDVSIIAPNSYQFVTGNKFEGYVTFGSASNPTLAKHVAIQGNSFFAASSVRLTENLAYSGNVVDCKTVANTSTIVSLDAVQGGSVSGNTFSTSGTCLGLVSTSSTYPYCQGLAITGNKMEMTNNTNNDPLISGNSAWFVVIIGNVLLKSSYYPRVIKLGNSSPKKFARGCTIAGNSYGHQNNDTLLLSSVEDRSIYEADVETTYAVNTYADLVAILGPVDGSTALVVDDPGNEGIWTYHWDDVTPYWDKAPAVNTTNVYSKVSPLGVYYRFTFDGTNYHAVQLEEESRTRIVPMTFGTHTSYFINNLIS